MQRIITQAQQYGLPLHEGGTLPPESEVADMLGSSQRIHAGYLRVYDDEDPS